MAQPSLVAVIEQTIEPDHRRQMKRNCTDSTDTSQDDSSDDPTQLPPLATNVPGEDDVIGISISRVQSRMRSPQTPAIEKARLLNDSASYFGPDAQLTEEPAEDFPTAVEPSQLVESNASTPTMDQSYSSINSVPTRIPSPWRAHRSSSPRFTFSRSVLVETTKNSRQRSFSGPSMLENLRKYLPDLPSTAVARSPGHSGSVTPNTEGQSPLRREWSPSFSWSTWELFNKQQQPERDLPTPKDDLELLRLETTRSIEGLGLDGSIESLLSPISPKTSMHRPRSSSENSIYLNRRLTGLSTFDDISAFADISDMGNSRFKAITDSLQNSSLRFPKMPSMKPSKNSISHERSRTDQLTRENTEYNAAITSKPRALHDYNKNAYAESPQQRAHPVLSEALSKTTGDIIVMGGYRGSVLRSAKPPHRQVWAPVKIGLNLRQVDLEVGLNREDEEKAEETIIPSGVLSHIGPIDICRRLLKHLRKCPNARDNKLRVHDWGYDWRLSPDLLSEKLLKFVESLECNQPNTPREDRGVTVIAHSLGGLITRHAVNKRPDLFAGVIYAGTPQNCVNILGPLRNGDDVLLSSRVLTAQVNFTLRTSFALLPEDGRCFIHKHTNERYDLDFFDPQVWDEYRLSPCVNPSVPSAMRYPDHRKSIMGSLSEGLSTSLPSFTSNTTKRTPWFGSRDSSPSPDSSRKEAAKERAKDTAHDVARGVEQVAQANADHLELSMRQPSGHRKPSIATACTIPRPQAVEYLARTLSEVRAFKQQLNFIPAHHEQNLYPPHSFIFCKTVPTVYGARVASKEAIKYTDAFDDLAFAAGDGVVLASAAQLPVGYKCVKNGRVESDRGHVGLLGDLEGVGRCLSAIVDARAKGVGLGVGARGRRC